MAGRIRSYLEDAIRDTPDLAQCKQDYETRGANKPGGFTEFSGSYVPEECNTGMMGGSEYYRAYRESELARMAPDVLSKSVRSSWDDGFVSMITPDQPEPVSLVGFDAIGPQSFSSNTRNMTLDLRGEAAYAPDPKAEPPSGAGLSSFSGVVDWNAADRTFGSIATSAADGDGALSDPRFMSLSEQASASRRPGQQRTAPASGIYRAPPARRPGILRPYEKRQ